jgi:hypothetical protein
MGQLSVLAEHFVEFQKIGTVTFAPAKIKLFQLVTFWNHLDERFKGWVRQVAVHQRKLLKLALDCQFKNQLL